MTTIIYCKNSFIFKKLSCMCLFAFCQNYIMFYLVTDSGKIKYNQIILKCAPNFLNLSSIYFEDFLNNEGYFQPNLPPMYGLCSKHIMENIYHISMSKNSGDFTIIFPFHLLRFSIIYTI